MMRTLVICLVTAAAVAVISTTGAQAAETEIKRLEVKPHTQAFLKEAAEDQLAQIAWGQLATQHAKNVRVKHYGEEMVAAHKKMMQEIEELAAARGIQLPSELDDAHKRTLKELSQLSGHAFDRTYLQHILGEHQNYVNEFEEGMHTLEDADVLRWTYKTLPMLRAHVEEARWTKMVLHAMD